eukprot:1147595-Pelagomonas_calceolata.AAC.12
MHTQARTNARRDSAPSGDTWHSGPQHPGHSRAQAAPGCCHYGRGHAGGAAAGVLHVCTQRQGPRAANFKGPLCSKSLICAPKQSVVQQWGCLKLSATAPPPSMLVLVQPQPYVGCLSVCFQAAAAAGANTEEAEAEASEGYGKGVGKAGKAKGKGKETGAETKHMGAILAQLLAGQ